jgi:large subunit ribosomal protein L34
VSLFKEDMPKTKRTYQPHKAKRINTHGYMARKATTGGEKVIKRRIAKGRKTLTVSDEVRQDKTKRFKRLK